MTLLLILLAVVLLMSVLPFSAYASLLDSVAKLFSLVFRPLKVSQQHATQPAQQQSHYRKFNKQNAVDTDYEEMH